MYVDFVYYVLAKLKEPKNYLNFSARILLLASEKNLEIFSFWSFENTKELIFFRRVYFIFLEPIFEMRNIHTIISHNFFGDTIFLELQNIHKKRG